MKTPFSALLLALVALVAQPVFAKQLDLREAYKFAVENAPAFQVPQHSTAIANFQLKSARARFLPKLTLDSSHGIQDSEPSIYADPWVSNLNLDLTEDLYDNGVSITGFKIAKATLGAAKFDETVKLNAAAEAFMDAYLDHSFAVRFLDAQKRQLNLVKKEYESIERLFKQGMKTRFDFLRFKAQRMRAELALINAEADLKLTKERLLALLGIKINDPNYEQFEFKSVDENEIKNLSSSNVPVQELPAFKRNQLQLKASELNIDLASRNYGPEFYLTTGIGYRNQDYINANQGFSSTERIEWKALLGVKWQIWDWGQRKNDVSIARLTSTVRRRELELEDQTLRANYSSALLRFAKAQDSFSTAQELMTLESGNYDYLQRQYRTGALNYLNLIDGLESLIQAQNSYYRSYHDVLKEHSSLLSFEGRLHDFLQK